MSTLYVNTITPNSGDTVNVSGSLFVSGTINLGDAGTDSISFGAEVSSSIIPDANNIYDLGSDAKSWKVIYGTSSLALTASHVLLATSASHLTANGASPSQTSITSVGTLTSLGVAGNVFSINSAGSASMGNITSSGNISASGTITGNAGLITTLTSTNVTASNALLSGDLSVGDDLSLTSDSAVFNMGAGNDFKITHDGTTGAKIKGSPIHIESTGSLVLSSSVDAALHGADDVLISALDDIEIVASDDIKLRTTSADGELIISSSHTAGRAIHIDANANAGSIVDIDAGILDIDVTGVTTINSTNIALNGPVTASGHVSASQFIGATFSGLAVSASYAVVATTSENLGTDLTPTLETKTAGFTAAAGREYIVNDADGAAIVLPNAVAGARITIVIGTLITSNTTTITAQSGDLLKGYAFLEATDAANNKTMFVPDGSDDLIITLNGSTKGGLVGDRIELVGISETEWRVRATLSHTGTAATPFS